MFKITKGVGFQLTFENEYTLSVQFGAANYCEHHDKLLLQGMSALDKPEGDWKSKDAEIAIVHPTRGLLNLSEIGLEDDSVKGYVTVDELFEIMQKVRNLSSKSVDLV